MHQQILSIRFSVQEGTCVNTFDDTILMWVELGFSSEVGKDFWKEYQENGVGYCYIIIIGGRIES